MNGGHRARCRGVGTIFVGEARPFIRVAVAGRKLTLPTS